MLPTWAQGAFSSSVFGNMDRQIDAGREMAGVYNLLRETGGGVLGSATTAAGVGITRSTGAMDWAEAKAGGKIVMDSGGSVSTQAIESQTELAMKAVTGAAGMVGVGFGGAKIVGPRLTSAPGAKPPPMPAAQQAAVANAEAKAAASVAPAAKSGPSVNTKVIETPEVLAPRPVKPEAAVGEWNNFLGPSPHSNVHPRTGVPDPNRIVSADGTRSIRYGPHEMNSKPTKHHYHEETWSYDAPTDTMTVTNTLKRTPTN